MKNYDQLTNDLLERRDRYVADRKRKRKRMAVFFVSVLCVCIVSSVVFAVGDSIGIVISGDGIARRGDLDREITVTVNGGERTLTYDKSRSVADGFADVYKDGDGNDWIVKNGELTGYYANDVKHPAADAEPIGRDAAVEIAVSFLRNVTEYADEYGLCAFSEKESYGQYYITLARRLGEVFTDECAEVWVMYDGAVKSADVDNAGKYKDTPASVTAGVTEAALNEYVRESLMLIFPGRDVTFDEKSYVLKEDEKGYYVDITVKKTFGNGGYEYLRYDIYE